MRSLLAAAALLALSACQSGRALEEGKRINWRCAGDNEFSLRRVATGVEVFAAGQTHRLDPVAGADGQYSNGAVTLNESGRHATLTSVYGGPYHDCERRHSDWWFDFW